MPAPLHPRPVEVLWVSVDGTGVPARPEELVGRAGKQPDGSARTREVKLAAVFTHARPAPGQRPFRDVDSTSYLADIVEASGTVPKDVVHHSRTFVPVELRLDRPGNLLSEDIAGVGNEGFLDQEHSSCQRSRLTDCPLGPCRDGGSGVNLHGNR